MSDFGWGLVLLGAYVLLVVLARWIYIARTNVVWTSAQAEAMTKRLFLQVERDPSSNGEAPLTQATLKQLVDEIRKESPQRGHTGVVGWNGSHQIAQWVLMHEAERRRPAPVGGAGGARLRGAVGRRGDRRAHQPDAATGVLQAHPDHLRKLVG